jgi:hypothetical protein
VSNEEDTVFSLIQEPVIGRKDCFERQADIERVIRSGRKIYLGAHGNLNRPRVIGRHVFTSFPKNGKYYDNGRSLQFSVIKNENGRCYSSSNGTDEPCMPEEFPIKNWPKK